MGVSHGRQESVFMSDAEKEVQPMIHRANATIGGRELFLETGNLAKQAHGSVQVRYGDTVVLVTACSNKKARENIDFLPLTVDYRENYYGAGRVPGGVLKGE